MGRRARRCRRLGPSGSACRRLGRGPRGGTSSMTGPGRAEPVPPAAPDCTTVPSEYASTTVNTSRSATGIGLSDSDSSATSPGFGAFPGNAFHSTAVATWVVRMREPDWDGWLTVRIDIFGAQPGTE